MIASCSFYHGLYRSLAQNPKSTTALGNNEETLGALESQLPQLYAAVIELSVKAKNCWNPPSIVGEHHLSILPLYISNIVKKIP